MPGILDPRSRKTPSPLFGTPSPAQNDNKNQGGQSQRVPPLTPSLRPPLSPLPSSSPSASPSLTLRFSLLPTPQPASPPAGFRPVSLPSSHPPPPNQNQSPHRTSIKMGGALLRSVSPASSEGGSDRKSGGGGAPLWSPGKGPSRVQKEVDSSPETIPPTTSLTGDSTDPPLAAEPDLPADEAPKTPSDQEIRTPEKPQRTFSKSTLRAAARALLNNTVTSVGVAPPALTLSAYPGPGAVLRHQPSLPIIIPTSVPVAISAPQVQGLSAISGSTTHNFIHSMQSMNLNSKEENLHPTQKVSKPSLRLTSSLDSFSLISAPRFVPLFHLVSTIHPPSLTSIRSIARRSAKSRRASGVFARECSVRVQFPRNFSNRLTTTCTRS